MGERGFPQAAAMLRCRGVIKTAASAESSRGRGSGLLSAWSLSPSPASRTRRAAATLRRPSLGTLSYNKLFARMRHGFPLPFNSQITSSLKRKASWGSEAAVKLSIVELGTEPEAPCVSESFAVAASCFPSLPRTSPGRGMRSLTAHGGGWGYFAHRDVFLPWNPSVAECPWAAHAAAQRAGVTQGCRALACALWFAMCVCCRNAALPRGTLRRKLQELSVLWWGLS